MSNMCDNFIMYEDNQSDFKMWQGLVGAHYTPYVDGVGNLSWTNNGGLPNPPTVNVTGKGLTITGIAATTGDLPATANQFDCYLVGTVEPYSVYMYYNGAWVNIGEVGKGEQGEPGFSPVVTVSPITGGHQISITDAEDTETFNVMDGQNGVGVPSGGQAGYVLAKATSADYDTEWIEVEAGGGTVQSVNEVLPDLNGNITLTADDIGTDATNISIQDALDDYVYVGTSAPTDPTTKVWLDTDEPGMSAVSSVNGKTGTVELWDVVWENASPTSSFSAQTVSIDLSGYEFVIIEFSQNTSNDDYYYGLAASVDSKTHIAIGYYGGRMARRFATVTSTGVTFGNGQWAANYNSSFTDASPDSIIVPIKIRGFK